MWSVLTNDLGKKLRFARNFLRRRMVHVNLQISYNCNFRCGICDFWKEPYRDKGRLSAAEAAVIANKLNEIGPQIISIGGGEPMLHPELVPIVRALRPHHFPVMITNGSLVTAAMARQLWQAGMVEISVSLDYADPHKHDAQRGKPGAFEQGVAALKILHATRTHPEQRVHMISVIVDDNLDEVEPLIELSRDLGITYLVTLYSHSRGNQPSRAPAGDLSRRLLELKQRHRHFVALRGYLARFSAAAGRTDRSRCHAGHNLCNIDCRGMVSFCIDRLEHPAGNLLTDNLREIESRLLASHRANDCRACWTSCRGSIEAILYGRQRLLNAWDYHQMTRPVPLHGRF
ncbi:MAG: radical SAM protein [Verrucomicrobia bacterium]|nr:radical SAM protein [Verrucomicrobiota bacterium]